MPGAVVGVPLGDRTVARGFGKGGSPLVVEGVVGYVARWLRPEWERLRAGRVYLSRRAIRDRKDAPRRMADRREESLPGGPPMS
ncbi:hypothetical protein N4G70_36590 [Streptomyces sp. ASQP_92]|uniref:hypothetical protein n=1 Tax=Streptomyces sp. ASQP_92 TaxID=2979116 RepID=UPI0021BF8F91|nr:hypothetical protein [Streptomyces sp. ASQP_92]MCT9094314.1 hypothetical protein [Streptomyces sp. ASQP_92]